MSRSFRHTPIFGIAIAVSERKFKAFEHRRARRATRAALGAERDLPHPKRYGNRWDGPKDGRQFWADAGPKDMRK